MSDYYARLKQLSESKPDWSTERIRKQLVQEGCSGVPSLATLGRRLAGIRGPIKKPRGTAPARPAKKRTARDVLSALPPTDAAILTDWMEETLDIAAEEQDAALLALLTEHEAKARSYPLCRTCGCNVPPKAKS